MLTTRLVLDYFLFVLVAAWGVLQVAASHNRLKGLLFFRRPALASAVGGLAVLGAFLWFFGKEDRNVRGIEGTEQFALFLVASAAALAFSLLVPSLAGHRRSQPGEVAEACTEGLGALREMSYLQALKARFPRWRGMPWKAS